MSAEITQLSIVTISLCGLFVLPFLPISFFLFRGCRWPQILLAALVLGLSLQAMLGMLWSHLVYSRPLLEVGVLLLVWLGLLYWSWKRWAVSLQEECTSKSFAPGHHAALILILCIGFLLRIIHPFDVAYLGQSDAYTHLDYIHSIVNSGCLSNPSYPSGFHWIMALPELVFSVDPYHVARYGGAFFGIGLILGIYVLLESCIGRRTALFGSFCAAAFPGMMLLIKTAVGVFANQFGLLLLPALIFLYMAVLDRKKGAGHYKLTLMIGLCGMAAAVPMMLLHIFLIYGCERFLALLRNHRGWLKMTLQVALISLPAVIFLVFHVSQVGPGQRYQTATIMTDYSEKKTSVSRTIADRVEKKTVSRFPGSGRIIGFVTESPYFKLLLDYCSVKRIGFGNPILNIVGGVLAVLFFALIVLGLIQNKTGFLMVGVWGLLTSIQAGTGFLQFSAYQREGWSLLVATCCLSGIVAARIYRRGESFCLFRLLVFALMAVSAGWAVMNPPSHPKLRSSAEDELVRTIRSAGQGPSAWTYACKEGENLFCVMEELLVDDLQLILVTRRFIGWTNQGEIAPNVLPPDSTVRTITVDKRGGEAIFQPGFQYLVLVDEENVLSGGKLLSTFAMVSPAMVKATLNQQRNLFMGNEEILRQMKELLANKWSTVSIRVSDRLTATVIVPLDRN